MISVYKALKELKLSKDWVLKGEPTNKAEFENQFLVVVGADETNTAINSSDPKDFGVAWDEIVAKQKELQDDYDSKKYQRDRASDYPPLAEQIDLLYHGGLDALKAELKKTKDKFPKPE